MEELYRKYQGKTIKDDYGKNSKEFIDFANDMKKSMKINAAKYGLRLITFETGHYDMCGYFKDNETKKYAYFSFHECRNHPIDFDMMNSKGFLIRSAKGLNDCTGGYNNFTDLRGFFQLVKQIIRQNAQKMRSGRNLRKNSGERNCLPLQSGD